MVMDNNDRAQLACILLADYEPLVILIYTHYIILCVNTYNIADAHRTCYLNFSHV